MAELTLEERVMRDVYGDWTAEGWKPKPLPVSEAGGSPSGQRRYLWTDAFGVLNFVALAERQAGTQQAGSTLAAASRLIDAVHECLGAPRGDDFPMRPASDGGFEGLRIGKERARLISDSGMEFDGMYWHYLDKWIFALARYARAAGDGAALQRGLRLVRQVHPRFLARLPSGEPLGLHWKMNVDLTTIPGRERTGPNGDAVGGLIAYTAMERARVALGVEDSGTLAAEIADLKAVVQRYVSGGGFEHATDDPLGFGLQCWEAQFFDPELADGLLGQLAVLADSALHRRHLALPFRLYGGIIGARLSGRAELVAKAEALLASAEPLEMATACGEAPHSGINKVMFATALNPSALGRREGEDPIGL